MIGNSRRVVPDYSLRPAEVVRMKVRDEQPFNCHISEHILNLSNQIAASARPSRIDHNVLPGRHLYEIAMNPTDDILRLSCF